MVQPAGTAEGDRCGRLEYIDINTGERNSVLTPGGMGQVAGHRLKFGPADPEQGVFFMAPDGSSSARVSLVGKNMPGELMFLVPDTLAAGDCILACQRSNWPRLCHWCTACRARWR
jgi:hypothetical protein